MKIHWAVPFRFMGGNAAGYTGSSINLRKALVEIGVEITESAKVAFHYCHPADFFPISSKRNFLMTMYESKPVPPIFEVKFKRADAIFTPTKFCYELFKPIRGKKQLIVSKLGFDENLYTYKERSWNRADTFQWLWIGAPNPRKGWPPVISAWSHLFKDKNFTNLTMKTSSETGEGVVRQEGNVSWDSRMYDLDELRDLYHSAHAFMLPSYGEGFGLPLLEAMATGLPVIATRYGGQMDFLDTSVAYFSNHTFEYVEQTSGPPLLAACADVSDLGLQMVDIMQNYESALERAKEGSRRAHAKWTWHHAAHQLVKHFERLGVQ